jgi:hypothetical protein
VKNRESRVVPEKSTIPIECSCSSGGLQRLRQLVKENSGLLFKRMGHIYFSSVFILTFSSLYTQKWRICYDEIETLEARS